MTAYIETVDTFLSKSGDVANASINPGDTFDGTLTDGSDVADAVNLGNSLVGEKYTVSVTFDNLDGVIVFDLVSAVQATRFGFQIEDGVLTASEAFLNPEAYFLIDPSEFTIEGNTLTFSYAPIQPSNFVFQFLSIGSDKSYSIAFDQAGPADAANVITGASGDDRLNGTDTADVADLGDGADHLNGKGGNDTIDGGAGDDKLQGGEGLDELIGGTGKDKLSGGNGNDDLSGGEGNDVLEGDAGNDTIDGGNNNDRIYGGTGDDDLSGGRGNDKMWGDAGADTLDGGHGNDVMNGGADNDVLTGGAGRDNMTGGTGADTFVFADGMGKDVITDFEDGVDTLDFSAYGFTDISDLSLETQGTDVLITADAGDTVLLQNVDISELDNSDFIWA